MFPDFLKVKGRLQKMLDYEMKQAHLSHMGPLADIPKSIIFEGNKTVVIREDGSVEENNLEKVTAELEVQFAEVEGMTPEMVLDKINRTAKEMAEKVKKSAYEQIEKSAEEVGNVVDADGQPFSMDLFFEMLEKIDRDFDEDGNPSLLMCPVNPKLYPSVAKVISQSEGDPEYDKRYKEIIERKREEWRARESNRKLVG